jgi:deoxyribodipyrimidine photo-lyase
MDTALVVFTRDLRVHDNPALHQACQQARQVVPLFVADPALGVSAIGVSAIGGPAIGGPARGANRARFLAESLTDLRDSLRQRGADLIMRYGDPAAEVVRLATAVNATMVYLAELTSAGGVCPRVRVLRRGWPRARVLRRNSPRAVRRPAASGSSTAAPPAGRLRRAP